MMNYTENIWVNEAEIDWENKRITLTPLITMDRKEFKEEPNPPCLKEILRKLAAGLYEKSGKVLITDSIAAEQIEKLKEKKLEFILEGLGIRKLSEDERDLMAQKYKDVQTCVGAVRLGGGVVLFMNEDNEQSVLLVQRTDEQGNPSALDICAGKNSDYPYLKNPSIPQLDMLRLEMNEIISTEKVEEKIIFHLSIPKNSSLNEQFLYREVLLKTVNYLLTKYWPVFPLSINITSDAFLGRFKDSWKIRENYRDGRKRKEGYRMITAEPEEGSIELIEPLLIVKKSRSSFTDVGLKGVKIRPKISFLDGEYVYQLNEERDYEENIEVPNYTFLERYILQLFSDGSLNVHRNGEVVTYGISAEDYIEKYGLAEAIRKGGIGATSKVLKLGEEGKRGGTKLFLQLTRKKNPIH